MSAPPSARGGASNISSSRPGSLPTSLMPTPRIDPESRYHLRTAPFNVAGRPRSRSPRAGSAEPGSSSPTPRGGGAGGGVQALSPRSKSNAVRDVLERDERGEFGDDQMHRAQDLLRDMRAAVQLSFRCLHEAATLQDGSPVPLCAVQLFSSLCDCVVNSKTSDRKKVLDRRVPLVCFVHEVVADVYAEQVLKRNSAHITAGFGSGSASLVATQDTETAAALLRMLSNLADFVVWAFFPDASRAAAKQPPVEFAASVSRTTIMGLRRTSALEAGQQERAFQAASSCTSVLHESMHEAFSARTDISVQAKLMEYYTEPITVPVYDDSDSDKEEDDDRADEMDSKPRAEPVPKGHVELTRWFLTLASLAAESTEEALVAALLQEIDFASEFLLGVIANRFETVLGVSVVPAGSKRATTTGSAAPAAQSIIGAPGALRRVQFADGPAASKKVLSLIHPLSNHFPRVVDAFVELTHLLRPTPDLLAKWKAATLERSRRRSVSRGRSTGGPTFLVDGGDEDEDDAFGDRYSTTAAVMRRLGADARHAAAAEKRGRARSPTTAFAPPVVNWQQNAIVHRLACSVATLLLERVACTIVDCYGSCVLRCESGSPATDEDLLLRNDTDPHFVKECIGALEETLRGELALDEDCLEALLPLRELCDMLALPAECFRSEGVFYSVLPRELVKAVVFGQIVESIPSLEPRNVRDASIIDLVSCADLCHACTMGAGMRVETEGELATLKWDADDQAAALAAINTAASAAATRAASREGSAGAVSKTTSAKSGAGSQAATPAATPRLREAGAAQRYRKAMDERRIALAKTFSLMEQGIADSLAAQQ